jgi:hypothetical protein
MSGGCTVESRRRAGNLLRIQSAVDAVVVMVVCDAGNDAVTAFYASWVREVMAMELNDQQ